MNMKYRRMRILAALRPGKRYMISFLKWFCYAGIVGIVGGFIGSIFHISIDWGTNLREEFPLFIYFLPLAGLIIVWLYRHLDLYKKGNTNTVVKYAQEAGRRVPIVVSPLIFVATFLTHLCGGSAGREGAAIQIGGSVASQIGRVFKVNKEEGRIFILCGMSALFSAVFGTPVTAMFFAMEVAVVGIIMYSAIFPCMLSSVIAYAVAGFLNISPTRFVLPDVFAVTASNLVYTVILTVFCAMLSIIFCKSIHRGEKIAVRYIKNEYMRAVIGGFLVILLTKILNTYDYNGAGMNIITNAVTEGKSEFFAFILKMLFTVITISAGFKGGEIIPTLFIGSTFGCVFANLVGMEPQMGAAIGMIAMFCGVLNCPVASIFLSIELFGAEGLVFFVIAVCISFMLSGYSGLYGSQKIFLSKLGRGFVNKRTKSR